MGKMFKGNDMSLLTESTQLTCEDDRLILQAVLRTSDHLNSTRKSNVLDGYEHLESSDSSAQSPGLRYRCLGSTYGGM